MNFSQFLLALKARKWVALTTLLITVLTTLAISLILPKTYTATTTLVIDAKGVDPVTGLPLPYQLSPEYMATQTDIISSHAVALQVVKALKLQDIPSLQEQFQKTGGAGNIQDFIAKLLQKNLSVDPSRTSNLVSVSYQAPSPEFAALAANTFAQAFIQTNLDLKTQPAQQSMAWFNQQIAQLRNNLNIAQQKLSDYQQKHGLVLSDERMDIETSRLADLSTQLVAAQAAGFDASSKAGERAEMPDVVNSPLVQGLLPQVATLDAELAQLGKTLGPNNPKYISTLAQRNALKKQLDDAIHRAEQSLSASAKAAQQRTADLREELAKQKAKALDIKTARDHATLLQQDVDGATLALKNALQMMSQTSLTAKSVQTDIAILNPAQVPQKPSGPKIILNTALALILGSLLGIGFATLLEILDRRVRSELDIGQLLEIPVLNTTFGKPRALSGTRRLLLPFRSQTA